MIFYVWSLLTFAFTFSSYLFHLDLFTVGDFQRFVPPE